MTWTLAKGTKGLLKAYVHRDCKSLTHIYTHTHSLKNLKPHNKSASDVDRLCPLLPTVCRETIPTAEGSCTASFT
jgi:hypothetical protein